MSVNRRAFLKHSVYAASLLGVGGLLLPGRSDASLYPHPKAVVETTAGKVRGGVADGVHIFRGIPYGADTGGKNRFMPPQPVKKWSGIRDTLDYGNMAPQGGGLPPGQMPRGMRVTRSLFAPLNQQPHSEDCLYLNVWSRGVGESATRPVMVWLHGGGFTSGSGASSLYDGTNLVRRGDVVVVTLNHRLGALGHLDLSGIGGEEYASSGNVGMLDLVQALEWVRDNIAAFGGDPNRVMIFGESGGGRKVSTLLAMSAAKGLFHSAVIHSGPGLRFGSRETAQRRTEFLLAELGLNKADVKSLSKLPFDKIIAAQSLAERKLAAALGPDVSFFELYGWSPVLGPDLPEWPFDPVASPVSHDVPVIIGSNRFEMALFMSSNKDRDQIDEATLRNEVVSMVGDRADALIKVYREAYPQEDLRGILLLIMSDERYRMDSVTLAERKQALGGAPIYMYRFDWETPVWDGLLRAAHALEIPFVFDNAQLSSAFTGGGPDAVALAGVMADTWISFARSGNPNNDSLPEWRPYDSKDRATMLFDNNTRLEKDPGKVEREAWQKIRSIG